MDLAALGRNFALLSIFLILYFSGILLYRLLVPHRERKRRVALADSSVPAWLRVVKRLWPPALLLVATGISALLIVGSPMRRFMPEILTLLPAALLFLLAGQEFRLMNSVSSGTIEKKARRAVFAVLAAAVAVVGVLLASLLPRMFAYPEATEAVLLDLPVRGAWTAGHAGGTTLVNYHSAYRSQRYAMDIVKMGEGNRFFRNRGGALEDFYAFGAEVFAPAAGVVATAVDGLPNKQVTTRPNERENPAGNHIVIEIEPGVYVFLAHLQEGSLRVVEGDTVLAGQLLAKIGNSGNTSWPHLHMHVQDLPVLDAANAIAAPYRFRKLRRKRWFFWQEVENGFLVRNDLFSDE